MTDPKPSRFLAFLLGIADDRAARATLRRGLGKPPGQAIVAAASLVERHLPPDTYPREREVYYTVAALFATHPHHRSGRTIARAFRESRPEAGADSQDRRYQALLSAEAEDLNAHLRHLVSLLASREEPFDWDRLLRDCLRWSHPDRVVQVAWARDYWAFVPDATTVAADH